MSIQKDFVCLYSHIETPIGMYRVVTCEKGLCVFDTLHREDLEQWYKVEKLHEERLASIKMELKKNGQDQSLLEDRLAIGETYMALTKKEITSYFNGVLRTFTVPLHLVGTPFQLEVWNTLQRIPYGVVWSYQGLAKAIGNPKACRAVGMANSKNPVSIIVPCHRVIATNGTLGGYTGGLERKRALLELEHIHLAK